MPQDVQETLKNTQQLSPSRAPTQKLVRFFGSYDLYALSLNLFRQPLTVVALPLYNYIVGGFQTTLLLRLTTFTRSAQRRSSRSGLSGRWKRRSGTGRQATCLSPFRLRRYRRRRKPRRKKRLRRQRHRQRKSRESAAREERTSRDQAVRRKRRLPRPRRRSPRRQRCGSCRQRSGGREC